jgi:hypothetical protein
MLTRARTMSKKFSAKAPICTAEDELEILYQIKGLKIFSVDQSDNFSKRYDLMTKEGELKIFMSTDNKLNFSLKCIQTSSSKREFINVSFNLIKFNELKIRNNKLTVKHKEQKDECYYYAIDSDVDQLIEICNSLIKLRDVYFPELVKIKNNVVKTKSISTACNFEPVNAIELDDGMANNKKQKWDEDEILNIFDALKQAIKDGNVEEAAVNAKKLATFKLNVNITLSEKTDVNNNSIVVVMEEEVKEIDGLFNVNCVLIKEDKKEEKNIFLENLDLKMKVFELKLKVWFSNLTFKGKKNVRWDHFIDRFLMNTK